MNPSTPSISQKYLRRSVPALFSVLLIASCAAWMTFNHLAGILDQQIADHSQFLAAKALDQSRKNLMQGLAEQAAWGNAYRHLGFEADRNWAYNQGNLGKSQFDNFGYEGVLVVTPQGRTSYAVLNGQLADVDIHAWLQGDIDTLLAKARSLEPPQGAFAYMRVAGQPAMVAAQVFSPGDDQSVVPRGLPAAVLVLVDVMTQEELVRLGLDYSLTDFHALPAQASTEGPMVKLPTNDGSALIFSWYPPPFAGELFGDIAPAIGVAALLVLALLGLIIHDAVRGAKALEGSYAQLAASREQLAVSEERFRDIAESASDWLWETDQDLRLVYLSARFSAITGHAAKNLLGRSLAELLLSSGPVALEEQLRQADAAPLHCFYTAADGRERVCRVAARPVVREGQCTGYRGTASDITEAVEAQAKVVHMSQHDALTGLPNRNRLRDFLDGRLALTQPVALLSLDLDRFKAVNDTLGHAAGDSVLHEVARRLRQCVREQDLVARLGGDEFILVLDGARAQDPIEELCTRLVSHIEQPFLYDEQEIFVGTSIGIALSPQDATAADELLRCADIALYQAKADGRATWRFYASEMNQRLIDRRQLEMDLRHALGHGQLRVHYQPRFRIDGLHMIGAEALVRWQHPERGLLLPEHFLPLAEETGLILPLGDWVLQEACRDAVQWPESMRVSVNLSPVQFSRGDVLEDVRNALRASGLPATRLELEVTESVLLDDAAGALLTLNALKALGVRLTMDDFGTGYSSLNYLRSYPFDGLKIDRSFIATLNDSYSDRSIVQAIVSLAQALDMTVTAEGVETPAQLATLRLDQCAEAQGFHLSRPQPATQLLALIQRGVPAPLLGPVTVSRKPAN